MFTDLLGSLSSVEVHRDDYNDDQDDDRGDDQQRNDDLQRLPGTRLRSYSSHFRRQRHVTDVHGQPSHTHLSCHKLGCKHTYSLSLSLSLSLSITAQDYIISNRCVWPDYVFLGPKMIDYL